jgi:hypothetical protein
VADTETTRGMWLNSLQSSGANYMTRYKRRNTGIWSNEFARLKGGYVLNKDSGRSLLTLRSLAALAGRISLVASIDTKITSPMEPVEEHPRPEIPAAAMNY